MGNNIKIQIEIMDMVDYRREWFDLGTKDSKNLVKDVEKFLNAGTDANNYRFLRLLEPENYPKQDSFEISDVKCDVLVHFSAFSTNDIVSLNDWALSLNLNSLSEEDIDEIKNYINSNPNATLREGFEFLKEK